MEHIQFALYASLIRNVNDPAHKPCTLHQIQIRCQCLTEISICNNIFGVSHTAQVECALATKTQKQNTQRPDLKPVQNTIVFSEYDRIFRIRSHFQNTMGRA